jgi:hypothetical protein
MKAILALSVSVAVLATCAPAWARLGESLEECISRYGDPKTDERLADQSLLQPVSGIPNCKTYLFVKHIDLGEGKGPTAYIYATVVDGVVERIVYTTRYHFGFNSDVANNFLSLNGWIGNKDNKRGNPDLNAWAGRDTVFIETRRFKEKAELAKKAKASDAMDGF